MAAAILGILCIGTPAAHAAAPALSITPLEWNIVGLDSNRPASGPNRFHIGARVCNTGDAPATGVEARWSWDTTSSAVSLQGPAVRALPVLEPGECASAWFGVEVLPQASSFNQARRFHITATAAGAGAVSTPTPREIYVEKLVSQARNSITGSTGETAATLGQTYTYSFTGTTSTTYEQLAAQPFFDPTIFEVQSVEMNVDSGQSVSQFYVDACGWVSDPMAAGYRSCAGADKAGGTFDVTVRVKVIGTGTSTVSTLVYDFSGSSYHYNSDYSTSIHAINVVASEPDPNTVPNAVDDTARTDEGVPVRVSVLGNDTDGDADPLSVTAAGDPANGSVVVNSDGTITYTPDTGFVGTDSFTYTISDGRGGQDTATVTVTVAPTPEPDPNTVPNAVDDTARLTEGRDQIVIDVLGNDRIPSGSALTITITEEPKHGHVVINADGTITYTATGNGDSDQFTYRVCDEDGSCSSAVVSVDLPDGRSSGSADDDAAGPSSQTPTNPGGSPALAFTGAAVPLPAVAAVGIVMLGLGVGLVLAARRSGSAV